MIILDGKKLRDKKLLELKEKIKGLPLVLAVIQVGDDEATNIYVKQKKIKCEELGITFNYVKLPSEVSEEEVSLIVDKLNHDETTGILLQLPLPEHLNERKLLNMIDYKKDIDGLTDISASRYYHNEEGIRPCTPEGILALFKEYNISLDGKDVVIVGRSDLLGKPLYSMLLNLNATVTVCHKKTKDLKKFTKMADIIISTTGVPNLITEDMVKDGAIVIDAGITRLNGKVVGDVDFENVSKKCSYITPVPGGCGPVTISALMENIYKAYNLSLKN